MTVAVKLRPVFVNAAFCIGVGVDVITKQDTTPMESLQTEDEKQ